SAAGRRQPACKQLLFSTTTLPPAKMFYVAFLDEQIGFTDITAVVASTLDRFAFGDDLDLETILAADARAREIALEDVRQRKNTSVRRRQRYPGC
ncbi:MAG: hypothetical protein D3908_01235, partial [Candidatus Electrothrix sp. AUS4]|nr:hypothetical protein [Candidatus Electrothrix sp. AUS4]